jgi:hypothetical protein
MLKTTSEVVIEMLPNMAEQNCFVYSCRRELL